MFLPPSLRPYWTTHRNLRNRKRSTTIHGNAPAQNETSVTLHGNYCWFWMVQLGQKKSPRKCPKPLCLNVFACLFVSRMGKHRGRRGSGGLGAELLRRYRGVWGGGTPTGMRRTGRGGQAQYVGGQGVEKGRRVITIMFKWPFDVNFILGRNCNCNRACGQKADPMQVLRNCNTKTITLERLPLARAKIHSQAR